MYLSERFLVSADKGRSWWLYVVTQAEPTVLVQLSNGHGDHEPLLFDDEDMHELYLLGEEVPALLKNRSILVKQGSVMPMTAGYIFLLSADDGVNWERYCVTGRIDDHYRIIRANANGRGPSMTLELGRVGLHLLCIGDVGFASCHRKGVRIKRIKTPKARGA